MPQTADCSVTFDLVWSSIPLTPGDYGLSTLCPVNNLFEPLRFSSSIFTVWTHLLKQIPPKMIGVTHAHVAHHHGWNWFKKKKSIDGDTFSLPPSLGFFSVCLHHLLSPSLSYTCIVNVQSGVCDCWWLWVSLLYPAVNPLPSETLPFPLLDILTHAHTHSCIQNTHPHTHTPHTHTHTQRHRHTNTQLTICVLLS